MSPESARPITVGAVMPEFQRSALALAGAARSTKALSVDRHAGGVRVGELADRHVQCRPERTANGLIWAALRACRCPSPRARPATAWR